MNKRDKTFISTVLFTIAFLLLLPPNWHNAQAGHNKVALASMGWELASYAVLLGQLGVASLALTIVVLMILWKGYVNRIQWTWFVMFVIVWGWYFPLLVVPNLKYLRGFDPMKWLASWADISSWSYNPPTYILIFLLMLTALILPARSFFRKNSGAVVHPTDLNDS